MRGGVEGSYTFRQLAAAAAIGLRVFTEPCAESVARISVARIDVPITLSIRRRAQGAADVLLSHSVHATITLRARAPRTLGRGRSPISGRRKGCAAIGPR
jgi:hypothetical protein